ncbi:MAG: hypothetical protein U5N55_05605 [Cypionkella sp.]|nr:hypothetical protein [Cypionkella sp.]
MDHGHFDDETGPWPMGWAVAAGAGVIAALLVTAIGGASAPAGFVIGLVSFGVFGALLGSGGVERGAQGAGDTHEHGHGGGHH